MQDQGINRTMGLRDWGLVATLSVIWGGSFFFIGIAVKSLPPLTLVFLRVALAAAALNLVIPALGLHMPRDRGTWSAFFAMGFLNNLLPFSLIVWGQTHIASGLASILNATTPVFTVIVAHFLTRDEKLTSNRLLGVLIGLAGVGVIIGPDALKGLGVNVWAQTAVLGAAVCYSFAGIYGRRFRRLGVHPVVTAAGQVSASAVMLLPLALAVDHPWRLPAPGESAVAAVLGLALLSTALAYIIFFRVLASAGATNIMLVTFLIPVSAILLGSLFLGEQLSWRQFLGMGLIGAGLAAIDGRLLGRLKRH
ncbi:MAG: DMT family transporter [Candidatus Contendobacter sp.]|jgi:drug/metabolite transporter (DMT)-like permease|nr:DMT family transporter [Candidatus Contendobacter sp.]